MGEVEKQSKKEQWRRCFGRWRWDPPPYIKFRLYKEPHMGEYWIIIIIIIKLFVSSVIIILGWFMDVVLKCKLNY